MIDSHRRLSDDRVKLRATAALLLLTACDDAARARAYLEDLGYADIELTAARGGYDVVARQADMRCTGKVVVEGGFVSHQTRHTLSCSTPERPPEPPKPPKPRSPVAYDEMVSYPKWDAPPTKIDAGTDYGSSAAVALLQALLAGNRVLLVDQLAPRMSEALRGENVVEICRALLLLGDLTLGPPTTEWAGNEETIRFVVDHTAGGKGTFELMLRFRGKELVAFELSGPPMEEALAMLPRLQREVSLFDVFLQTPDGPMLPYVNRVDEPFEAVFTFDGLRVVDIEPGDSGIRFGALAYVSGPDGKTRKIGKPQTRSLWTGVVSVTVPVLASTPGEYEILVQLDDKIAGHALKVKKRLDVVARAKG